MSSLSADHKNLSKLKESVSELRGSLQQLKSQMNNLMGQLADDRLRDIDSRHNKKLIELTVHRMSNTDLDTYYKALDKALMHFHSIKMKEINEVLKDYWRTVYRGKDIDEIYIKSAQNIENKRRNYSYSVMMKTGDTELEMRGRCSAGQRVLASLLIRLALADTFCLTCGVLALDEPTTNLDAKNIRAFASALNEILNKRREQTNFQLIVITHDENFVDEIGRRSHCSHYFRVYKDANQHSKIRKQALEDDQD